MERARLTERQQRDDEDAARATTVAGVALGSSVVLILLFGGYLTRAIAVPLRGAAAMAARLAGGDLSVRLPETGMGEVGALERAFSTMGGSLEASRDELERLADEQAALRRVATLVARDAPSSELFQAVATEVGTLFGADHAALVRFEDEDTVDAVVLWVAEGDQPDIPGYRPVAGLAATIVRTGRPARQDGLAEGRQEALSEEAASLRMLGIRSVVGSPILVGGGCRRPSSSARISPSRCPRTRSRGSRASPSSSRPASRMPRPGRRYVGRRTSRRRCGASRRWWRRVPTSQVFEAVTREVGLQCDADFARMERFEPDRTVTAIAASNRSGEADLAVGSRFALEGTSIAAQVLETGRPARVDSFVGTSGPIAREARELGIGSSVGCPIVVGGRTWGVIAASTTRDTPFPPNTESRIADFTELVAAAVSNA